MPLELYQNFRKSDSVSHFMAEEVLLILQFSHCKISSRAELLPYQEQQPSGPYLDARAGGTGEGGLSGALCVEKGILSRHILVYSAYR